ncbi:MAG: DUF2240 family protein [Candidatus Aenigmarchaeota archaeon]|nr:DUF2240 family protein [Candidatus Aenigmarchaeota archaeon]
MPDSLTQLSFEQIVSEIAKHASMGRSEVLDLIEEKRIELSDLVSREGAAYIVARELGLNLLREGRKQQLKIKNLMSGLRSVDLTARVVNIFPAREFEKAGRKGRVANIILGDDTGQVRLSLWDSEIGIIEKEGLKEGNSVKITGGYTKTDPRGGIELRVGRGRINIADTEIEAGPAMARAFGEMKRSSISEFSEGQHFEVRAALVQVFERTPFYEVCPECGFKLKMEKDGKTCKDHGMVKPAFRLIISGILDDGTGNVRAVFFRDAAEKLFGRSTEELRRIAQEEANPLAVFRHLNGIGRELIVRGRAKRNDFSEKLEFVVNDLHEVDAKEECKALLKGMKSGK